MPVLKNNQDDSWQSIFGRVFLDRLGWTIVDPRRYQTWKLWFLQATDLWTASSTLEAARWSVRVFSLKRWVFFWKKWGVKVLEPNGWYIYIYQKQPLPKRGQFSGVRGYVVDSWEFIAEGWGFWSFIKWRSFSSTFRHFLHVFTVFHGIFRRFLFIN